MQKVGNDSKIINQSRIFTNRFGGVIRRRLMLSDLSRGGKSSSIPLTLSSAADTISHADDDDETSPSLYA